MGYEKSLDYINPLKLWNFVQDKVVPKQSKKVISTQTIPAFPLETMALSRVAGHLFIKLAGVSGAIAVGMGAYGSHGI